MARRQVDKVDHSRASARVAKKIVKASELHDPPKILIYGRAKVGKTRLAASAPKVLLLDIDERGTKSTRRDLNPDVYRLGLWQEVNEVYWYLQEGNHPFETVAIDGLTGLQRICMNFVLGEVVALDASRDPDMPSRQVWGKVGQLMKTQITNYRNLDMNVVFTALQRVNREGGEDEEDIGDSMLGPAVSPSVSGVVEASVDIIGYLIKRQVMVKRGGKRTKVTRKRLIVEGSERYLVGDRTGVLPQYVDAPDLTELFTTINNLEATE